MWYQQQDVGPRAPAASQPASSWENIPDEAYRNLPQAQAFQLMGFTNEEAARMSWEDSDNEENGRAPPCAGRACKEEGDEMAASQADPDEQGTEDWHLQNAIDEVLKPANA